MAFFCTVGMGRIQDVFNGTLKVLFAFVKLCSNRSKVQSCSHRTDVNIMMKLVLHIQMKLICCLLKLNHFGK